MRRSFVLALAFSALLVAPAASFADDKPVTTAGGEPAKTGDKTGETKKPADSPMQGEPTRADRAKKLVMELQMAIVAAREAKPVDPELVKTLEAALEQAQKLTLPITKLADLTPEERKALEEEMRKKAGDDKKEPPGKEPGGGLNEWQQTVLTKAFEDVDLSEEEHRNAEKLVGDWLKESWSARGDSKRVSDLKRDRDEKLEKAVGRKKAQKIINNLNGMSNWGGKR